MTVHIFTLQHFGNFQKDIIREMTNDQKQQTAEEKFKIRCFPTRKSAVKSPTDGEKRDSS